MSEITEIVDSLENMISKLLHRFEVVRQQNEALKEELASVKAEHGKMEEQMQTYIDQVQTLKAANAMLGSTDHKRETKLKINSLIREIDQCIVQLSE